LLPRDAATAACKTPLPQDETKHHQRCLRIN
jgi:hypothetical protein